MRATPTLVKTYKANSVQQMSRWGLALCLTAIVIVGRASAAAPDWVIPGATVEMDFEHNRYHNASLDDLSVERPTDGYAQTKSGLLQNFAPNKPRLTDLGLLVETAQCNFALWSRDLTKDVWVKTNMKAEPAALGADGKAGGSRLTATAANATVRQMLDDVGRTSYGGKDKDGRKAAGGVHSVCYIKRVSGTGPVKFNNADVTALINANGYTQLNMRFDAGSTAIVGLELGTAGDVIDMDMFQFTVEGSRNTVFSSSPYPLTDKVLWRERDMVTVNPASNLYKALAGKKGTVYVKTLNLLGDGAAFYTFTSKGHHRSFAGRWGSAPNGAMVPQFEDGALPSIQTVVGSDGNRRRVNYAWRTVGDKGVPMKSALSLMRDGATVRSVLTWGDGKASVVANNGPVGTGACSDTEADGTLYLGFTKWGGGDGLGYINGEPSHKSTYMCDGYIQDIAFIPEVVEGHGTQLTVGPEARPAGSPPKLPTPAAARFTRGKLKDSQAVMFYGTISESQIYYTLDGSVPDKTKTLYSAPFEITADTITVKARAYKAGHAESDISEATFAKAQPK